MELLTLLYILLYFQDFMFLNFRIYLSPGWKLPSFRKSSASIQNPIARSSKIATCSYRQGKNVLWSLHFSLYSYCYNFRFFSYFDQFFIHVFFSVALTQTLKMISHIFTLLNFSPFYKWKFKWVWIVSSLTHTNITFIKTCGLK